MMHNVNIQIQVDIFWVMGYRVLKKPMNIQVLNNLRTTFTQNEKKIHR